MVDLNPEGFQQARNPGRRIEDCRSCHMLDRVKQIELAFPDGPLKHREAHEAWMEAKKSEKEFYDGLKKAVMEKGIAGFFLLIFAVIGLAVTGLMAKLGIPFGKM